MMVYHRGWSIVPCAVQWDLAVRPSDVQQLVSARPTLPGLPPSPSSWATTGLFSVSGSLFLFYRQVRAVF